MGYLPNITGPEMAGSPTGRHYHTLMEHSAAARGRGDHQEAQHFATAAHKWAMDEHMRLQQIVNARDVLELAARRLQITWDKNSSCETLEELREHHPESKRVIVAWERANDALRELSEAQTDDGSDAV